MKIKSRVNGAVIDLSDEGAKKLIDAGIYDAVPEADREPPRKPKGRKST